MRMTQHEVTVTTDELQPSGIVDHHDGHGLAESLEVEKDAPDPNAGGASHRYDVLMREPLTEQHSERLVRVARIQFQHGPRHVDGSTPGCLDSVLLAIVLDRLRAFQAGPFPSRQNALVITKLEEALHWMHNRAHERARRQVLGKNER